MPDPQPVTTLGIDVAAARTRARTATVLDVRPPAAFARGHLIGSGNLELAEFHERRSELPPREASLLVVGATTGAAADAAGALVARGYTDVRWFAGDVAALADPDTGWETGPARRLWRPNRFLSELLPRLSRLPRGLRALDLAAGSGRDAVFLALNGFEVEAWDFDAHALVRAAELAAREGVQLSTLIRDLEQARPQLPEARWSLIVCFRYLHRPLLPMLARALVPGGYLVYETYRAGQEQFGRPARARFLLQPGELRASFPTLEMLHYDEPSPPGGPWTARLFARRPPSNFPTRKDPV